MTEKNSFAYKLFLSLNISGFNLSFFFIKIATPPEKSYHPLFQQPPFKVEVLSSPPLPFEKLVGGSIPPSEREGGGGAHYDSWGRLGTMGVTSRTGISMIFYMKNVIKILQSYRPIST